MEVAFQWNWITAGRYRFSGEAGTTVLPVIKNLNLLIALIVDLEVRAWNGETDWKFPDGEEVRGYCKPEEVLRFTEAVSQLPDRKAMEVWEAQYCTVPEKSFPVKSSKAYKILKASGYFALAEQDDRS